MVSNAKSQDKHLGDILKDIVQLADKENILITGLALDSRKVTSGMAFLAAVGTQVDGRNYIAAALENGARAVIAEKKGNFKFPLLPGVPLILIEDLNSQISQIAANFFNNPSQALRVIGITGTNGKTTCAQLMMQLFTLLGETGASIGTMGYGLTSETLIDFGLTTPDAVACQQYLAELRDAGATSVAMEVSSHGLTQGRVEAINFNGAMITNITRDHLDYHASFDDYCEAKALLFKWPTLEFAVVNSDDRACIKLAERSRSKNTYAFGLQSRNKKTSANILAADLSLGISGLRAQLTTPWGEGLLESSLIGKFNLYNLLAVVAAACACGYPLLNVLDQVKKLVPAKGRLQKVAVSNADIMVCVDYAHTPDALDKAVQTLRAYTEGKLWVVFGCGGDRDTGKRSQMGAIASKRADVVVVTSDNPRSENPQKIIDDILLGIDYSAAQVMPMHDREAAIQYAIMQATASDVVLVAGKGHEDYQIIGDKKLPFDDYNVCKAILKERTRFVELAQ